jgi:hypothetical protein
MNGMRRRRNLFHPHASLKCYKVVVLLGRLQSLESIGVGKKGLAEKITWHRKRRVRKI